MQHVTYSPASQSLASVVRLPKVASSESLLNISHEEKGLVAPPHSSKSRIDFTKYKTKLCRHFVRGVPCPFRERCVFAHEEEVAHMTVKVPPSMPETPREMRMPSYTPELESLAEDVSNSLEGSMDFRVRTGSEAEAAMSMLPPPPPYEAAVVEVHTPLQAPTDSDATSDDDEAADDDALPALKSEVTAAFTMPAQPRWFRYNPYSPLAISYVYA